MLEQLSADEVKAFIDEKLEDDTYVVFAFSDATWLYFLKKLEEKHTSSPNQKGAISGAVFLNTGYTVFWLERAAIDLPAFAADLGVEEVHLRQPDVLVHMPKLEADYVSGATGAADAAETVGYVGHA